MKKFIVAIDQGTTSTRSILFDLKGNPLFISQKEFKQFFPNNGWVEHDPDEIWSTTLKTLKEVVLKAKQKKGKILTIGITNQRETTILWNKKTGKPIYKAIVWQDRRTEDYCNKLKKLKKEKIIFKKTGLPIDPYFSATKIKWILDNVKNAKKLMKNGNLLFGTVDTYLIWKFNKGKIHATDATNASRTMLYNINSNIWDKMILNLIGINKNILPKVKNCSDNFGETHKSYTGTAIKITGVVGDQQAATIGQACFSPGSIKVTYGTGAFVLLNTGNKKIYSKNKLITTIAYRLNGKNTYAMEGSIFIAGAGVQWIRDKMKLIKKASETEKIIKKTKSNKNLYLVPAFTGLGAPYWDSNVRGILTGITRDTKPENIIRSTLESVAYQTLDLFDAMKNDGLNPKLVKIDGGMIGNKWFSKFLSNIINKIVLIPKVQETTALGAAFMAGLNVGVYKSLSDISKTWKINSKYYPSMNNSTRMSLLIGWKKAIKQTLLK